ncbi:MAG: hypothetical protein DCC67_19685 [Planctomycetota bacterium]|nr:MAG: hypothetical protein DCC67_19685 [Planctomycetota bacterium]
MNQRREPPTEDRLLGLLADYDEALAAGTAPAGLDNTGDALDDDSAAQWNGLKQCLELLHRQRPDEHEPVGDAPPRVAATQRRRLGRFELLRELGRGGLGIVYLAHDGRLRRDVALKVPRFESLLDDELRMRFLREAEATARLNHPNIVALYEVGQRDSIIYLATEYCRGPTLAQWLAGRTEPVPCREAAEIVRQLAEGVEHAHARGVLHRDVKPSNVLLHDEAAAGAAGGYTPKLADFGMAKLLEQDSGDRTRSGAIIGTLAYMAPEQLDGRLADVGPRTDVYGLGAVLYELVTGAAPYAGESDVARLRRLAASEPPSPRSLRRDAPHDLEAIILKCLARDPAQRYASARELADDLTRLLEHRPTLARPLRLAARGLRWARRRRAVVAVGLVSLAAAAALAAVNLRLLADIDRVVQHSDRYRVEADRQRQRAASEQARTRRLQYASQMRKAREAWQGNNLTLLREMLAQYGPGTPEAHLRHFEWHHLNYLANLPHVARPAHQGEAYAVAYSPQGDLLLTGGQDGAVHLWDATSYERLHTFGEHADCVNCIALSPDGDAFATASCDKTVKLWSLRQRRLVATLAAHTQPVDGCGFADDGRLLASLSRGVTGPRELLVWDVASRSVVPGWPPAGEPIRGVAASSGSGQVVVLSGDDQATVWRRQGSQWSVVQRSHGLVGEEYALVSPDGEFLVRPWFPRYLRFYRLRDGALVNELREHAGGVVGMAFDATGRRLATAAGDSAICVFGFPDGRLQQRMLGHAGRAWQVAWSPSGESLASVGSDGTLRVWNTRRGSSWLHLEKPRPVEDVAGLAFLNDGVHVNAVYGQSSVAWNVDSGEPVPLERLGGPRLLASQQGPQDDVFNATALALRPGPVEIAAARFSPDGNRVAVAALLRGTSGVHEYETLTGTLVRSYVHDRIVALAYSADGERLAIASGLGYTAIHDTQTGEETLRLESSVQRHLLFAPDGTALASDGPPDGGVFLWPGLMR